MVVGDVLQSALPSVGHLPAEERSQLVRELADAVKSTATSGDLSHLLVLLAQWRHTAEVYADPVILASLTSEPDFDPSSVRSAEVDHRSRQFVRYASQNPGGVPARAEANRGLRRESTAPATQSESKRVAFGPAELATLEVRLSTERIAPYRAACGGHLATAIALYEWNAEISAALGATLGHVEVLLRNALHDELSTWSTKQFADPSWYRDPGRFLFAEERADIAKARSRATRDGRHEAPGRVVAELSLGFWRFLLSRRYDRGLWHPCLHRAFPGQRRRTVYDAVRALNEGRNRMAHHEPMFNRPVADLRATALQVAGWICPVTRDWIDTRCRVPRMLNSRPIP